MKRTLGLLGALTVAGFGVLAISAPAYATGPETKTVALKITDRDDSGFGTPTVWARDTFNRKVTVVGGPEYFTENGEPVVRTQSLTEVPTCAVVADSKLLWKYTATVLDNGTFVTLNTNTTGSPGKGEALKAGAEGTIKGGALATFYAPAHWCSFVQRYDGAVVTGSQVGSTSEFLAKLFGKNDAKLTDFAMPRWSWTYERCVGTDGAEKWVNKLDAAKGTSGDINGDVCPTQSPSPSPSSPSASPTTTSPSHTTTPPVAGGNDNGSGGLPVTGAKAGTIFGVGGAVLVIGAIAYVAARKRRDTKFVAE